VVCVSAHGGFDDDDDEDDERGWFSREVERRAQSADVLNAECSIAIES